MCRAMGWISIAATLAVAACGGGGLEQAADGDASASSGGDDGGGPTTLPPSSMTTAAATSDAMTDTSDGMDSSLPTSTDPTASASSGDPTGDTGGDESGPADTGESSDGPSTSTGVLPDCVDQDEGNTYPLEQTGSTTAAADDIDPGCGNGQGSDIALRWTAPATGTYVVHTIGSEFDTILSVRSECDGDELACNDDIDGGDFDSALTVDLVQDQSILIVVDGANGATGEFTLHVTWEGYGNCLDFPLAIACGPSESCFSNAEIGVCGEFNCTGVADCPAAPPSGNAPVVCRDIGGTPSIDDCGLDCSGGQTCPTGMSCLGNGICYW
jgi:hypothetical protein